MESLYPYHSGIVQPTEEGACVPESSFAVPESLKGFHLTFACGKLMVYQSPYLYQ